MPTAPSDVTDTFINMVPSIMVSACRDPSLAFAHCLPEEDSCKLAEKQGPLRSSILTWVRAYSFLEFPQHAKQARYKAVHNRNHGCLAGVWEQWELVTELPDRAWHTASLSFRARQLPQVPQKSFNASYSISLKHASMSKYIHACSGKYGGV